MAVLFFVDGPFANTQLAVPEVVPPPEYRVALMERRLKFYAGLDDEEPFRTITGVYVPIERATLYRFDGVEV